MMVVNPLYVLDLSVGKLISLKLKNLLDTRARVRYMF